MDKLLFKALGTAYRNLYPIEPVLTPRLQALLLRLASAEARPSRWGGHLRRATF